MHRGNRVGETRTPWLKKNFCRLFTCRHFTCRSAAFAMSSSSNVDAGSVVSSDNSCSSQGLLMAFFIAMHCARMVCTGTKGLRLTCGMIQDLGVGGRGLGWCWGSGRGAGGPGDQETINSGHECALLHMYLDWPIQLKWLGAKLLPRHGCRASVGASGNPAHPWMGQGS